jgi:hypothetical protein
MCGRAKKNRVLSGRKTTNLVWRCDLRFGYFCDLVALRSARWLLWKIASVDAFYEVRFYRFDRLLPAVLRFLLPFISL